jgi:hypothetical protein
VLALLSVLAQTCCSAQIAFSSSYRYRNIISPCSFPERSYVAFSTPVWLRHSGLKFSGIRPSTVPRYIRAIEKHGRKIVDIERFGDGSSKERTFKSDGTTVVHSRPVDWLQVTDANNRCAPFEQSCSGDLRFAEAHFRPVHETCVGFGMGIAAQGPHL